jgi:hypothetical protein
MIQKIDACPSYSCLFSLEEKTPSWNCVDRQFDAFGVTSYQPPMGSSFNVNDTCSYREDAPLCISDDDDDENDNLNEFIGQISLQQKVVSEEPLKDDDGRNDVNNRIRFNSTVAVTFIPSHRDYPEEMRSSIWASSEEIRVNAIRNQMQLDMEYDIDNSKDKECDDESESVCRFIPLQRMEKAR